MTAVMMETGLMMEMKEVVRTVAVAAVVEKMVEKMVVLDRVEKDCLWFFRFLMLVVAGLRILRDRVFLLDILGQLADVEMVNGNEGGSEGGSEGEGKGASVNVSANVGAGVMAFVVRCGAKSVSMAAAAGGENSTKSVLETAPGAEKKVDVG